MAGRKPRDRTLLAGQRLPAPASLKTAGRSIERPVSFSGPGHAAGPNDT